MRRPWWGTVGNASAFRLRLWIGFVVALLLGAAFGAAQLTPWGRELLQEVEGRTLDWRFRLRGPMVPPADVVVLAIDDASLAQLGRWPLPRTRWAEMVDRLAAAGARTVALDLLLVEPEQGSSGVGLTPGDLALRDALKAQGNAVLAMALLFQSTMPITAEQHAILEAAGYSVIRRPAESESQPQAAEGALLPLTPFAQVASLGHVTLILDEDGSLRRIHLALAVGDVMVPAFPVVVVRRHLGLASDQVVLSLDGYLALGEERFALDRTLALPVNYYGPAGTVPTYSLASLLAGDIPDSVLAGKLVVVGVTALGLRDTYPSPFDKLLPGVEMLATSMGNMLAGEPLLRPLGIENWEAAATVFAALLAWALANLARPQVAAILGLLALALWPIGAYLAFTELNLWLAAAWPMLSFILTAVLLAGGRSAHERRLRREAERQRRNLARYVSPVLADQLASEEEPTFEHPLQPAAILFCDLSGFTRLAEAEGPEATARFLRELHGRIEEAVTAHRGIIVQFLGDGALVLFGLPAPTPDDPVRALACARQLVAALATWRPGSRSRAGLHYGPVVIARVGGAAQAQLAAAGDTVNVAARLEGLAKAENWALAASDALVEAVRQAGRHELLEGLARRAPTAVRGREGRLAVWWATQEALLSQSPPGRASVAPPLL
jgi:adenylate cyclase